MRVTECLVLWVGQQPLLRLRWLHTNKLLHGDVKMDNLLVFKGPYIPHIRIGDPGSCVELGRNGVPNARKIKWCITTHTRAAPELLIAGQQGADAGTPAADLFSWGGMMMKLAGTQEP